MKRWLHSEKVQKRLLSISLYGIIICVFGFFVLRNDSNDLGIPDGSEYWTLPLSIPFLVFLYYYYAAKLPITRDYYFGEITKLDGSGFTIGNILDEQASRRILWDQVTSVKFSSSYNYIEIYFKTGNVISIRKEVENWYELARQIPREFEEFEFEYLSNLTKTAELCDCCGHVAFLEDECRHCGYYAWDPEIWEQYPDEQSYLKAEQLQYFSTYEKGDPVEFYPEEQHPFFRLKRSWKPSVTEAEVLEYSKEHNW